MFKLAVLIGIYSYLIFGLGVMGLLYRPLVFIVTLLFLLLALYYNRIHFKKIGKISFRDKLSVILLIFLSTQALVNLIGVFGPEISFDALWYHLTLPKIYILHHAVIHIPGNLLFYSDMPKLTEMLYTAAMILVNEHVAKFIHFSFGILILVAIYKLSRKYLSKNLSLLSSLIFYSSLVVGWESITAYVDLARTFFEVMVFWGFVNWTQKKEKKWLIISGTMLGLSATVKLVAYGSLLVFIPLFAYQYNLKKEKISILIKDISYFVLPSLLVPVPWFIFSFVNTGNPFYPYFTNAVVDSGKTFVLPNLPYILKDAYTFFLKLNDPISPIYLIVLPLVVVGFKNYSKKGKELAIYALMSILVWYLFLENRGGRFILPYLPVISILSVYSIKQLKNKYLYKFLIAVIILISLISIGFRGIANAKFVLYILGRETKTQFLNKYLNFSFGDFYDTDGYLTNRLTSKDTVLLYGFSKLYYVNFNCIDSSWVKKGDKFNYIAVQNVSLPQRFNSWHLVYYNPITKLKLYYLGGQRWVY